MNKISVLNIDTVTISKDLQQRTSMDEDILQEYTEVWKTWPSPSTPPPFPPVHVVSDGKSYWLYDGYYRIESAKRAGKLKIEAQVTPGDRRLAILLSCGANATHGLRRTNEDKRRAVGRLLADKEWRQWSDHEIAKRCGVSQPFVGKM